MKKIKWIKIEAFIKINEMVFNQTDETIRILKELTIKDLQEEAKRQVEKRFNELTKNKQL